MAELTINDIQDQMKAHTMPDVRLGQPVLWHPTGIKGQRDPEIAFVLKIGRSGKSIRVMTASGIIRDTVPHVTDPRLTINVDQRENGAWEYTEDFVAIAKEREDLLARMAYLESALEEIQARESEEAESVDQPKTGYEKYREVFQQARTLGIDFTGHPKISWLRKQIAALEEVGV